MQPRFETFAEALRFAEDAWVFGDHSLVVEVLGAWLLPDPPPLADALLIRAWSRLGSSAFFIGDIPLSQQAFLALLRLDPGHELDRLVFPAQVINLFERVRSDHAQEWEPEPEGGARPPGETVWLLRSTTRQPRLVSALPFGVGFLSAGREVEGTAYLIGQSTLATVSLWAWMRNEQLRGPDGFYDDAVRAQGRQRVQVGTGLAFFTVLVANVVHGWLTHRDEFGVRFQALDGPPEGFQPPLRGE